jgi:predicted Zn-dependent protease
LVCGAIGVGRRWRWLAAVAVVGAAAVVAGPHGSAWYHFLAGRDALDRYRTDDARAHLAACLRVWPGSAEAHRLAARAARRADALEEAREHLTACQRLEKTPSDDTTLEWALLHAAGGDLGDVEDFLYETARNDPDKAPLVWEALACGYLRVYRVAEALTVLQKWLDARPDDLQALALRADVYWTVKAVGKATDDYRRVVARDPDRAEARERLGVGLMETGRFEEALPHLDWVRARRPDDPDVLVRLARCYMLADRERSARETLDAVLTAHPGYGPALCTRGLFAREAGQADEAEKWLREAVRATPDDYQANYMLATVLSEAGRGPEAKEQMARAQRLKDRLERFTEITTREMSMRPRDPALQAELGKLLLDKGYKDVGEGWLLSALKLDPHQRDAHLALADYYRDQGDAEKADYHRREAEAAPPSSPKAP